MTDSYRLRCTACGHVRTVTAEDCEDTDHTPRSKAHRAAKHAGTTCDECDDPRLAVTQA